jgi:hypothetical protein
MGKTKARGLPNNRLLVLRECEALIIGPVGDSALERAIGSVFCWVAGFGHPSTGPDPPCDGSREERIRYVARRRGFNRAKPR